MISLLLLALLLLVNVNVVLGAGQVRFLSPNSNTELVTSGQVAVQIEQVTSLEAADGDEFQLRLRHCKAIFSDCFDDHQIVAVPALDANVQWVDKTQPLTASFPASEAWESSDKYVITFESVSSGFKAKSAKFTITSESCCAPAPVASPPPPRSAERKNSFFAFKYGLRAQRSAPAAVTALPSIALLLQPLLCANIFVPLTAVSASIIRHQGHHHDQEASGQCDPLLRAGCRGDV